MNNQIGDILSGILSDKNLAEKLVSSLSKSSEHISPDTESSTGVSTQVSTQVSPVLNEKQQLLQRKIDIITSLKPLLGEEYSNKADIIIKALNAALIIAGLKN